MVLGDSEGVFEKYCRNPTLSFCLAFWFIKLSDYSFTDFFLQYADLTRGPEYGLNSFGLELPVPETKTNISFCISCLSMVIYNSHMMQTNLRV